MVKYSITALVGLVSFAVGIFAPSATHAAPVTFRFEAVITNIFNPDAFDPGIDISINDIVRGKLAFNPNEGDGSMSLVSIQPHSFSLNIDDVTLSSSSYQLQATNNEIMVADPPNDIVDSLQVQGSGLYPVQAGNVPAIDFSSSTFRLNLVSTSGILSQASYPADAEVWNSFQINRTLNVGLDGLGLNGAGIGVQANIGQFSVIPEPAPIKIFLIAFVAICGRDFSGLARGDV
jgi:hypothetical protein